MILCKEKEPDNWEIVPLGNVCLKATKVKRKEVDNEKELIYLDIGSIDNLTNRITDHKVYKWKDAPSRAQQIIQVGDILFSTVRVYLRNIAKIDCPLYENQICSSGFTVIRGYRDCCDSKYLFAIALYEGFLQPLNELQTGTSYPAVRDNDVFSQLIPLPPLPEQRAIVSKIEQLFSELDNGIANLKLAQEQLKVYRQAVLKKAFEGELTRKWREQQTDLPDARDLLERIKKEREKAAKDSLKKIKTLESLNEVELEGLPKLPDGWIWVKIDSLVENYKNSIKAGPFGSSLKKEYYVPNGFKIYGQEQVISGDPAFGDYYISEDKYRELESCKIKPFDVLISLVGTIGKVLILPENCEAGIINPRLIKLSLNRSYYWPIYFKYYFESMFLKSLYKVKAHGATMDILTVGIINELPFPLCSIEEQQAIVQEIETRLSVCDKIEQDIETNLERAEALRQSILKKAFEGKLLNEKELAEVRKAEDWEPAEVLLERIKAEKAGYKKKLENW